MKPQYQNFIKKYYTVATQKLAFHLLHVSILGMNHCGKARREAFKGRRNQHDVLCRSYYAEQMVFNFAHQIQSEYYSGNWSISIEGISLDHFSASNQSS